ncbi:MAG: 60 kDa inner rane insertion protein [Bacteroidetes bacterium]|nr:60 kDa inner rane insertion protein [Bacteroidota bacterium]
MDNKNTLIGTLLLGLLVFGLLYFGGQGDKNKPKAKTETSQVALGDSAAHTPEHAPEAGPANPKPSDLPVDTNTAKSQVGPFAAAVNGEERDYIIENEFQKVTISSRGGAIKSVELKKYKTWDQKPLMLFTDKSQNFSYQFPIADSKIVDTKDLYFQPIGESFAVKDSEQKTITFRLNAGDGQYFEQKYTLHGNDYKVGYEVNVVGLDKLMPNSSDIQITWKSTLLNVERSVETERRYSALYYRYADNDPAHLDEDKTEQKEAFVGKADWISFKQQFFNATIFGKGLFGGAVNADFNKDDKSYVKKYIANLSLPYHPAASVSYPMSFYFGPNHYSTLKKSGDQFEGIIKLSPDNFAFNWIKYVTKWAIIPTFNVLDKIHLNYGIIILLLTILLKLVLTPLTWKAIKSGAFMKVLKPEIDALKEKYGDDQTKISQEQMKIYQKAGVSPFGGCLPMVLQMPILMSMYYFFPNSIELRQQPFLWATDLSSYDSIMTWATPILGQTHLSLFTVLMTITSILSAVYNQAQSGMSNQQPGMKYMPYIMPVMLMFMFNGFPAALTYYYLLQNVLTIAQQWAIQKFFIDEKALHAKIEENKKNPAKKSGLMKKLEDIQKQAEAQKNAGSNNKKK